MPVIFISYRREDSAGHAGRLFDRLRERFGRDRVFLDVVGIQAGVDFVETIDKAVGSCDVLLAVIGREWLTCADKHGRRRLDDPNDFIRAEISAALKRNVRVVPVLVEGAEMPPTDELPEELKRLTRRQAVELRDSRWDADAEDLIAVLEGEATQAGTDLPPRAERRRARGKPAGRRALLWGIGALVAALLAVGAALYFKPPKSRLVRAPNLAGLSLEDAIEKLRVSGFVAGRQEAKQTNDAPARRVLRQRPAPGEELEPGTPVDLVYAEPLPPDKPPDKPPDTRIEVPNVVGAELRRAMETLRIAGLAVAGRSEPSREAQRTVLRQEPAAGSRVAKGTQVTLVYAETLPDMRIAVPDVVGTDVRQATEILRGAGFGLTRQPEPSRAAQSTVLRQKPAAGSRVAKGTRVTLVYAEPLPDTRIAVPDVIGADVKQAMGTIQKAGLEPFRRSEPSKEAQFTVLRQDPVAGSRVDKGTQVTLFYAVPVVTGIEVPDVVGAEVKQAMEILQKAGLDFTRQSEPSRAAQYTVLRQEPQARSRVKEGTRVTLVYAIPEDKIQTTVYIYYAGEKDQGTAERLASYLRGLKLERVVYRISLTKPDLATGRLFYPLEEQAGLAKTIAGRAGFWLSKEVYGRETHLEMELDPRVRKSSLILTLPGGR